MHIVSYRFHDKRICLKTRAYVELYLPGDIDTSNNSSNFTNSQDNYGNLSVLVLN